MVVIPLSMGRDRPIRQATGRRPTPQLCRKGAPAPRRFHAHGPTNRGRSNKPDPLLGDHSQRNRRQIHRVHYRTVPLGDATRRPTPDAELPALSAGVVGRIVRASHSLYGPLSGSAPGALATSSAERSSTDAPSAAEAIEERDCSRR